MEGILASLSKEKLVKMLELVPSFSRESLIQLLLLCPESRKVILTDDFVSNVVMTEYTLTEFKSTDQVHLEFPDEVIIFDQWFNQSPDEICVNVPFGLWKTLPELILP